MNFHWCSLALTLLARQLNHRQLRTTGLKDDLLRPPLQAKAGSLVEMPHFEVNARRQVQPVDYTPWSWKEDSMKIVGLFMIGWYQLVHEWQIEVQLHYPYLTPTRPRNWKLLSKQLLARQWAVQKFHHTNHTVDVSEPLHHLRCIRKPLYINNGREQLPSTGEFSLDFWLPSTDIHWGQGRAPMLGRCHDFHFHPCQPARSLSQVLDLPLCHLRGSYVRETLKRGSAANISSFWWALLVGNMFLHIYIYIYIHYIYLAPNMGQANSSCLRKARFFLKNESLAI